MRPPRSARRSRESSPKLRRSNSKTSNSRLSFHDQSAPRQFVRIDIGYTCHFAAGRAHGGHLDVDTAFPWQAEVHRAGALRAVAAAAIDDPSAPHSARAGLVDPDLGSGSRYIDPADLRTSTWNGTPGLIGRHHVAIQVMCAVRIIIRDGQIERAIAIEIGPQNSVGCAVSEAERSP